MTDKVKSVTSKGKGLANEFREFIMRGNVLDMAVGVIIGGAFQKIISSLVDDIIMPVISIITGGIDFNNMFVCLDGNTYVTLEAAKEAGAVTLNYGTFITVVKCRCSCFLGLFKGCIDATVQNHKLVVEINSACKKSYEGHDNVIYKG